MPYRRRTTPLTGLVIPTTHWDRDWYWPFERFRVKLIELFDRVKGLWRSCPAYRFAMDGQAVAVEDYLEAVPGDRSVLRRMGTRGRFTVGPLYVQSDLYCTGGEAFIRNMLLGAAIARELDALQRVVYLPDTFGHTPSIPMLVRGFGYDTYVFMRGLPAGFPSDKRFFRWRAPDGSVVRVFRLRDGYGNAARLGLHRGTGEVFDKKSSGIKPRFDMQLAVQQFTSAMDRQVDSQGAPYVLLAGVDHQIPQPQLPRILARCATGERTCTFADWNDVAAAMRTRRGRWYEYEGECHGIGASSILGGTVSTRIYLKQANADAERALGQVAEPADAVAKLLGIDDPAGGAVRIAWKRLLKAHPHDDITGCSVDSVHRENEMHIACATQAADAVRRRMAERLIEHFGGQRADDNRYAFFVMGTQCGETACPVTVKADFEGRLNWGDISPSPSYDMVDEQGDRVAFRELSRERSVEHPHPVVMLRLYPHLRPFTFQRFYLRPRSRWPSTRAAGRLENERVLVTLQRNGSIDLLDKNTRTQWRGLGLFSDQADCGDEYTFSHIRGDAEKVFDTVRMKRTGAFGCNGLQVAGYRGALRIPVESSSDGRAGQTVVVPVEIEYTLAPGQPMVECRMRFTNTARDHRLRWNLSLPSTPKESRAGLKFAEVVRAATRRVKTKGGFAVDPEHPADHFVAVERGRAGLAVYPRFPVNYEIVRGRRPRLAVTVLRAVGFLSRSDMLTRGGGAGPGTPTPEAQCLRPFEMCFAIRPYDTAGEGGGLMAESMAWRAEPVTGLIMGYHPDPRPVPHGPQVEIKGRTVRVSSLKRTHDGRRLVLRVFNAGSRKTTAAVRIAGVPKMERMLLNETDVVDRLQAGRGGWVRVRMARYSLCTLVFDCPVSA